MLNSLIGGCKTIFVFFENGGMVRSVRCLGEDSPIECGFCEPARANGSICESISDLFGTRGTAHLSKT